VSQQPGGIPDALVPTPVELAGAPKLPSADPPHGEDKPPDIGTVINGLTPALSSSVEPSGIVPPFKVKVELVPEVDNGDAIPPPVDEFVGAVVEAHVDAPVAPTPPPSKTEPIPDIGAIPEPLDPDIEDAAELDDAIVLQFEAGPGLNPPGSISVAPSGMPVAKFDSDEFAPSVPSGEVVPNADGVVTLCACATLEPSSTAAVMKVKTLMTLALD
jgi:hypothetical protein